MLQIEYSTGLAFVFPFKTCNLTCTRILKPNLIILIPAMAQYCVREYADMWAALIMCNFQAGRAARLYAETYPNRERHPDANVLRRLQARVDANLPLVPGLRPDNGRPRNVAAEQQILDHLYYHPRTSTRKAGQHLGVDHRRVNRAALDEGLHPYHLTPVHNLEDPDYEARLDYCQWFINRANADPRFERSIMYTDESNFCFDGPFNCHNTHHYSYEQPHCKHVRNHQRRYSINIWIGIIDDKLV